jgi:hypothetical protein
MFMDRSAYAFSNHRNARQPGYLCPSKTTSQQNRNYSVVTFAAQTGLVDAKEALALCRSQPVADPVYHAFSLPSPAGFLPPDRD